jgi:multidrug efflux pump subunit AcrA (membrane-fusion protein)
LARRVPVVVQFRDQQIARATADAFVKTVYVTRGQRVKQGLLLVELDDPELLIQRDRKTDDLKIAQLRAVQYRRQGELSRSAAECENAASLRRQIIELNEQLDGLRVIAEREGFVLGPAIDSLQGRFVDRGAELLRVSDPQEKELLAAVSEADMQAYQAAASEALPALVRLRGGTKFQTIPASLRPRARRSLPHPAFAATVGGPLPVEPSSNEKHPMRLVEPQLQSVTPLDPVTSVEIQAGQIGTMTIGDNRSLVARLIDTVTHQ